MAFGSMGHNSITTIQQNNIARMGTRLYGHSALLATVQENMQHNHNSKENHKASITTIIIRCAMCTNIQKNLPL
jgi:hypothetical protein